MVVSAFLSDHRGYKSREEAMCSRGEWSIETGSRRIKRPKGGANVCEILFISSQIRKEGGDPEGKSPLVGHPINALNSGGGTNLTLKFKTIYNSRHE